jgi:hypothetical protein
MWDLLPRKLHYDRFAPNTSASTYSFHTQTLLNFDTDGKNVNSSLNHAFKTYGGVEV